jgi:hypothetical protein
MSDLNLYKRYLLLHAIKIVLVDIGEGIFTGWGLRGETIPDEIPYSFHSVAVR